MKAKTWARGKKKLTPEQKIKAMNWQKTRVKIANMIARKPEIKKTCCICGKPGNILHNKKDPYYITFICDECRKDPNNLIVAEESRYDIRTKMNIKNLSIVNITNEEVVRIVNGFLNEDKTASLGDYCKKIGLSRYQFNILINKYDELLPKIHVHDIVRNRFKTIQKRKLEQNTTTRNILNKANKK